MQADVVLEEELRVLHLVDNRMSPDSHTERSLIKRDLKVYPHSDKLPQTKPSLPLVALPLGTIFFKPSDHSNNTEIVFLLSIGYFFLSFSLCLFFIFGEFHT